MKGAPLILMSLLILNFAAAIDEPSAAVGEADVEELQGIIGQLPFDESGETNYSQYRPFYSKAEQRIDGINLWLDDNAGWMRYLFHMRPQVSILFTFNLYFILFFFLILFLNAKGLWFFIEAERNARIFGLAVFVVFAAVELYVGLAHVATNFLIYIWSVLLETGIWLAIIAMVVLIILAIFAFPVVQAIFVSIGKYLEAKEQFKQKMEQAAGSEAMNTLIKQATKK